MTKIIYYYPNPLSDNLNKGSSIRPVKMLQAFEELGYEIDLVSGFSSTRKKDINRVINNIKRGEVYSFVYAENTTMPTALSDTHHLPIHPLLDINFFRFLNKKNIPTGLFYRDIYWKFEVYDNQVPILKRYPAKLFYNLELYFLNQYLTTLFIPSRNMFKYIPYINESIVCPLPPAHDYINEITNLDLNLPLKLLYVGGITESYKIHELFKCVQNTNNVSLTVCTREEEWNKAYNEYSEYLSDNITIVHKSGDELIELYNDNHLSLMFFYPDEYREFAMPVKLYEYIFRERPIIASQGTLVAEIVKDLDIGWVVEYDSEELNHLLNYIINNMSEITKKIENCKKVKPNNTWLARAKQVEKTLLK